MSGNARGGHGRRRGRGLTMVDVARAAGVSVAVVSYAFNRPDRVASATRERVLAAAAAIGYAGPDPAARALRLGRRGAVALVGGGGVEYLVADPVAALVARGLAHACDRAGVALVLSAGGGASADGAVLLREAAAAGWNGGPAVAVDGEPPPGTPAVRAEVAGGAAAAAAHLAALGHRRLALISWPGAGPRLDGARAGWCGAGPVHALVAPASARAQGEVAARRALTERPRPDAVLALSDPLALGALDAAARLGLRAPGDVSVAGVDDLPGSDAAGLTTVFVPYRPMGDLAGTLLAAAMEAGAPPPSPPPLPTTLAIRATTGRPYPAS